MPPIHPARSSAGTIRTSVDPMDPMAMGQLINLGIVNYGGVDALARVTTHPMVEFGGAYEYLKVRSIDPDGTRHDDPLDRLPHHRWDGWVRARPDPRISALARMTYFGSAIDQTKRVDGYTLVEANVTAQITPQYLAVLRIDDLLNVRPETRAGYHTAGRVISIIMQGTWE